MFYGWYIVIAALLIRVYNEWVVYYGFTAFINPIANTFGWSYAQISLAVTFLGMETGILNPIVGLMADRYSHRRLVLSGVLIFVLGMLGFSQIKNLAMFYICFFIIGMSLALDQTVVPMTTVVRWFRKNVGKAIAIVVLGSGIGGSLLPLLVRLIDAFGWQRTLIFLAFGIWLLGIPLSFVFRNRPEDYGLLPDGQRQDNSGKLSRSMSDDFSFGVKEALHTRFFWHMVVAFMIHSAGTMSVLVHIMPYLASLGLERSTASMVAMVIPLTSLAGRLLGGWLADMFNKKYICALSLVITSVGLFLFWMIDGRSLGFMILVAVVFGFGLGAHQPLRAAIFREYFGTARFGTLFGLSGVFSTLGIAVAPPVAGWVFDTLGRYDPVWLVLCGVVLAGVVIILTAPLPPRKSGQVAG